MRSVHRSIYASALARPVAMADITATPVLGMDEKKHVRDDSVESIDEKLHGELEHVAGADPLVDLKVAALSDNIGDVYDNVRAIDLGADGKERPIGKPLSLSPAITWLTYRTTTETSMDYAVRLISLEDDPSLPIFTFRMWFLSLGLSCFGAVLSQIFVCNTGMPPLAYRLTQVLSISDRKPSQSANSSFRYVDVHRMRSCMNLRLGYPDLRLYHRQVHGRSAPWSV